MSDGLLARWWLLLYQSSLPQHPEPMEESTPERVPGLIDEAN